MSITSNEVNFLIYRYLQESGFLHSAFCFGHESFIFKTNIAGSNEVPPGALISMIQKGLQYVEAESHLNEDGTEVECDEPFTLLIPHVCKVKNERKRVEKDKRSDKQDTKRLKRDEGDASEEGGDEGSVSKPAKEDSEELNKRKEYPPAKDAATESATVNGEVAIEPSRRSSMEGGQSMDIDKPVDAPKQPPEKEKAPAPKAEEAQPQPLPQPVKPEPAATTADGAHFQDGVCELTGHTGGVLTCLFSPASTPVPNVLATGSVDSTVRLWHTNDNNACAGVLDRREGDEKLNVTAMDWNPDGALLATSYSSGSGGKSYARIYNAKGELQHELSGHTGPITAVKFNRKGADLVTVGMDGCSLAWDVATGSLRQKMQYHQGAINDADWRNNTSFATCGEDHNIYLCKMNDETPLKEFKGHTAGVNMVRWDGTGTMLASCSDDGTAKIWTIKQGNCINSLDGHKGAVTSLRWVAQSGMDVLLATYVAKVSGMRDIRLAMNMPPARHGSSEDSIKIWDVQTKSCTRVIEEPSGVQAMAFSANGRFLAIGLQSGAILIRSIKDWEVAKTHEAKSMVTDVCFNASGSRVAACCENGTVYIIDFLSAN